MDSGAAASYKGRVKVLVVEDEKKLASFVRKGLEERGFVVDVCHRGDKGCELATTRCYDGILLAALLLAPLAALHAADAPAKKRS